MMIMLQGKSKVAASCSMGSMKQMYMTSDEDRSKVAWVSPKASVVAIEMQSMLDECNERNEADPHH